MLKDSNINDLSHVLNITKKNIFSGLNLNFITPSQWLSNQLKSSSLLCNSNVRVINNGVDTNLFSINEGNSKKQNDFVIGFVSQNLNDENKAFHRLLEACSLLKKITNVKLLLIGELKQPINIHYQNEIVSNVTSKYDMVKYYQKMDIIVNTSTIETYPTTLMEAACCGVQCVGFNVGGVGEILNMCEGYSVHPFDINELSQKIETLQSSTIDRIKISQIAKENFSFYKMKDRYIDLYNSLISQSQ